MNCKSPEISQRDDVKRLSAVLGERVTVWEESEFLTWSGCPSYMLEHFLEGHLVQHDIDAVLAGKEVVGPDPIVLVHRHFPTRLYSSFSEQLIDVRRADEQPVVQRVM